MLLFFLFNVFCAGTSQSLEELIARTVLEATQIALNKQVDMSQPQEEKMQSLEELLGMNKKQDSFLPASNPYSQDPLNQPISVETGEPQLPKPRSFLCCYNQREFTPSTCFSSAGCFNSAATSQLDLSAQNKSAQARVFNQEIRWLECILSISSSKLDNYAFNLVNYLQLAKKVRENPELDLVPMTKFLLALNGDFKGKTVKQIEEMSSTFLAKKFRAADGFYSALKCGYGL